MWNFKSNKRYNFRNFYIPERMMNGMQLYIEEHYPTGDFLRSVLCNDLRSAIDRADDENIANLPAYIGFLYNQAPSDCWGSKEKYEAWIKNKG